MTPKINQFPADDNDFEDYVLQEVVPDDLERRNGWTVTTKSKIEGLSSGCSLWVPPESPVDPVVGMHMRVYPGGLGRQIRGIFLSGQTVYYRTEAEESVRHKEWVEDSKREKKQKFEENRDEYDRRFANLPEVFQRRVQKFRDTNPNFRWEFEGYELFCCEQAVAFAGALGTADALIAWSKLNFDQQKAQVPALDDGHSGNTFGCAVRLAYHYLTLPENVVKEHGALVMLTGCKEYGCPHPEQDGDDQN